MFPMDVEAFHCLPPKCKPLLDWFTSQYVRPVEVLPYESAEGGYIWIWGPGVAPREMLMEKFPTTAEWVVNETASALEELDYLWSPRPHDEEENYLPEEEMIPEEDYLPEGA